MRRIKKPLADVLDDVTYALQNGELTEAQVQRMCGGFPARVVLNWVGKRHNIVTKDEFRQQGLLNLYTTIYTIKDEIC